MVKSVFYKPTMNGRTKPTNKADFSQFLLLPQAAHCNTHVYFMEATQDTHTQTHAHAGLRSL